MACASDVMRTPIPSVGPADSLARAAELMADFAVRELPVVDCGTVVGVVARSDLDPHVGQLEWTPVRVAMSSPAHTVAPDATIHEVARMLLDGRLNGVPVVSKNVLAGMITRHDLLRFLLAPR
jgi:CBS domain-containing protein